MLYTIYIKYTPTLSSAMFSHSALWCVKWELICGSYLLLLHGINVLYILTCYIVINHPNSVICAIPGV